MINPLWRATRWRYLFAINPRLRWPGSNTSRLQTRTHTSPVGAGGDHWSISLSLPQQVVDWLTGDDLMKHNNCETLPCSCLCCSPASAIGSTENRGAAVGPMDKKHQYGSLERTEWSRDTHKAGYLVNNCWFIITFRQCQSRLNDVLSVYVFWVYCSITKFCAFWF